MMVRAGGIAIGLLLLGCGGSEAMGPKYPEPKFVLAESPTPRVRCGGRAYAVPPLTCREQIGETRVRVRLDDQLGNGFRMIAAGIAIDGQVLYDAKNDALADAEGTLLYEGTIFPGEHELEVALEFRGNGAGVFAYLRGYRFKAKTQHTFEVRSMEILTLDLVAFERGERPLEERPAISVRTSPPGR
ncbi:MAG: hypothetical protein R3B13_02360 [Polyangiaceae bacterium]